LRSCASALPKGRRTRQCLIDAHFARASDKVHFDWRHLLSNRQQRDYRAQSGSLDNGPLMNGSRSVGTKRPVSKIGPQLPAPPGGVVMARMAPALRSSGRSPDGTSAEQADATLNASPKADPLRASDAFM
jgi:hypothetical protein